MTFFLSFVLFFSITNLFLFAADSSTNAQKTAKSAAGADSKKQVYMGDPATKRGYELGYDDGVKAGKEDKKNGKKESPSSREEYKVGDKKFRSEYGSRAKFVGGYQGGFLKGYKSGYNREKIDPEAAKLTKAKEKETKTLEKDGSADSKGKKVSSEPSLVKDSTKPIAPSKPKAKTPTAADDAL